MLPVFGYDDAPHGHAEIVFENVRVPAANMLLGEGRGFEIAQGRLGPGPHSSLHAADRRRRARAGADVRARQVARRVRQARSPSRGPSARDIAESRIEIDQARLLTLRAAYLMDTVGNKAARSEIAQIKVVAPRMALRVLDRAIQAHGAAGVCEDFPLAHAWAHARSLRLADGPDEVHLEAIAKIELGKSEVPVAAGLQTGQTGGSHRQGAWPAGLDGRSEDRPLQEASCALRDFVTQHAIQNLPDRALRQALAQLDLDAALCRPRGLPCSAPAGRRRSPTGLAGRRTL